MSKSWRPATAGKCLPSTPTFYALAAVSIFCDVLIMILPIPLLIRLQINMRRKVGLIVIFTLGFFTTVCSGMRMAQIKIIAENGNSTMLVLWGVVELNVGIILSSLPALNPILVRCLGAATRDKSKDSSRSKTGIEFRTGRRRSGLQSSREIGCDADAAGTLSPPSSTHMLRQQDDQKTILTFTPASTPDSKRRSSEFTRGVTPSDLPTHSPRTACKAKTLQFMSLNLNLNRTTHKAKQARSTACTSEHNSRIRGRSQNRESTQSCTTRSKSRNTRSTTPEKKLGPIVKTTDIHVERVGGLWVRC